MVLWIILPITLSLVVFFGTWTVYGLAFSHGHVCPLHDWSGTNFCETNATKNCCLIPTISSSGAYAPGNSVFTATMSVGSVLFLLFSIFHHAHILEKHRCHSMLSKFALAFGVTSALGSFIAGNCNVMTMIFMHYFGAAIAFITVCFYFALLTVLTSQCVLTGYEKVLFPLRTVSTGIQLIMTTCHIVLYIQKSYFYYHLSAVFEWMMSINLELFQLSYVVEFYFFSSFMLSNLLGKREEEKPLILTLS